MAVPMPQFMSRRESNSPQRMLSIINGDYSTIAKPNNSCFASLERPILDSSTLIKGYRLQVDVSRVGYTK